MVTLGQNLLKLQWLSWINLNIWYKVNSFTFEQLFREGFFGFKNQQIKGRVRGSYVQVGNCWATLMIIKDQWADKISNSYITFIYMIWR